LLYAAAALNPGKRIIVTDVAVPISQFPELVTFAKTKLSELGVPGAIVGHAGDGNFHVGNFYDPAKPEEKSLAQSVNDAIVQRALALGGTATGEHGVGIGKTKFMDAEHGASLHLMKQIKKLIDPHEIMNPGKKF
jgi:D-lactate dehydrogenase (cytochrome)